MLVPVSDIRCTFGGFAKLANLWSAMARVRRTAIEIDCTALEWLDANMAAALGVLVQRAEASGNRISFKGLRSDVANILRRNGFLDDPIPDMQGSTIRYREFGIQEHVEFNLYVENNLHAHAIPVMSNQVETKFFEGINEIFSNSALHSETICGVLCCGQYFPKRNKLDFTISDGGGTIRLTYQYARSTIRSALRTRGNNGYA